jgi:molybdate transport system substrate-binding protein
MKTTLTCLIVLLLSISNSQAEKVKLAVASNFIHSMKALKILFEQQTEHQLIVSYGSSGKFVTQIENGAPFDVFLSADSKRPTSLIKSKFTKAEHIKTYAIGRLVFASNELPADEQTFNLIVNDKLAIANKHLAPYGLAATQVLTNLNLSAQFNSHLIIGENINQTFHYLASGATNYALIAYSQALNKPNLIKSFWLIPDSLHDPIEQKVAYLNKGLTKKGVMAWRVLFSLT